LGSIVLRQEVNVIDDQHICGTEVMAEIAHLSSLHAFMEKVHEGVARDVTNRSIGLVSEDSLAYGLEQVGLAQPNSTVDEVRVVRTTGLLGYSSGGHEGEPVARSDHKVFKDVVWAEDHLL
jgi:hypothetical protein